MAAARGPRVVVADDSALVRQVLTDAFENVGADIVGVAADGDAAIELCRDERPDVLTLDLSMPGTDGMAVLEQLQRERLGVRVVVVAAADTRGGAELAVEVLARGADDAVLKPTGGSSLDEFCEELVTKVQLAAWGRPWHPGEVQPLPDPQPRSEPPAPRRSATFDMATGQLVVIAASTGGPRTIAELLPRLQLPAGACVLIVQHMPKLFTRAFAKRLDGLASMPVHEAASGMLLPADAVLVAPGDLHLRLTAGGRVRLDDGEPVGGVRPRADFTIQDAAELLGARVTLLVLTGMGTDGLAGARAVHAAGGRVLTQAEGDCAVYGMPRQVQEAGLSSASGDAATLATLVSRALDTHRKAS